MRVEVDVSQCRRVTFGVLQVHDVHVAFHVLAQRVAIAIVQLGAVLAWAT